MARRRRLPEDKAPKRRRRRRVESTERVDCCGRPIQFTDEQRTRKARRGVPVWKAPEDMPDHMVLDLLNGVICGAFNPDGKGDDRYCRAGPVPGIDRTKPTPHRCRRHGGVPESQARPGHSISLKYGLYTDSMFQDEKEIWKDTDAEKLEDEIRACKIRLRRALIAEKDGELGLESIEEETGKLAEIDGLEVLLKLKKKLSNRSKLVDQIIGQLARLYALTQNRSSTMIEATSEGVKVYLPDNGR